jgi:hypothetical protein
MPAMPPKKMVNTPVMVCAVLTMSFCENTVKSSSPIQVWWRARRISETWSEAS